MWAWKIAPALAVGCTIVMKPSELTPLTALVSPISPTYRARCASAGPDCKVHSCVSPAHPRAVMSGCVARPGAFRAPVRDAQPLLQFRSQFPRTPRTSDRDRASPTAVPNHPHAPSLFRRWRGPGPHPSAKWVTAMTWAVRPFPAGPKMGSPFPVSAAAGRLCSTRGCKLPLTARARPCQWARQTGRAQGIGDHALGASHLPGGACSRP